MTVYDTKRFMLSRISFSVGTYKRSVKRHSNPIMSLAGETSLDLFLINSAGSVLCNKSTAWAV